MLFFDMAQKPIQHDIIGMIGYVYYSLFIVNYSLSIVHLLIPHCHRCIRNYHINIVDKHIYCNGK